jgi:hypothetical protein
MDDLGRGSYLPRPARYRSIDQNPWLAGLPHKVHVSDVDGKPENTGRNFFGPHEFILQSRHPLADDAAKRTHQNECQAKGTDNGRARWQVDLQRQVYT